MSTMTAIWTSSPQITISTNRVYINSGTGSFATRFTNYQIGARQDNATSIDLGDLDRDGYLDLIVGNENEQNTYYLNPGTGLFSDVGTQFSSTYNTYSVKLGDVDGDGDPDLLAGNNNDTNRLWYNQGQPGA